MSEVAPKLFQCGYCGAGPNANGFFPTWALFNVEMCDDGWCEATCIEAKGADFLIYSMEWEIEKGRRIGELVNDDPEVLPLKGASEFPLPVVIRSRNPAALLPGVLEDGMFTEVLGPKEATR